MPGPPPRRSRASGRSQSHPGPATAGMMPDRVETGRPLSPIVAITLAPPRDGSSSRRGSKNSSSRPRVPPDGHRLRPGLADADSERHRFAFMTGPGGLHPVTVEAYRGTHLGTVRLQVSVEAPGGAGRPEQNVHHRRRPRHHSPGTAVSVERKQRQRLPGRAVPRRSARLCRPEGDGAADRQRGFTSCLPPPPTRWTRSTPSARCSEPGSVIATSSPNCPPCAD